MDPRSNLVARGIVERRLSRRIESQNVNYRTSTFLEHQDVDVSYALKIIEDAIKCLNEVPTTSTLDDYDNFLADKTLTTWALETIISKMNGHAKLNCHYLFNTINSCAVALFVHEILFEILRRGKQDEDQVFLCCLSLKVKMLLPAPQKFFDRVKKLVSQGNVTVERAICLDNAFVLPLNTYLSNTQDLRAVVSRVVEIISGAKPKSGLFAAQLLCKITADNAVIGDFEGSRKMKEELLKELKNVKILKTFNQLRILETVNGILYHSKELLKELHVDVIVSMLEADGKSIENAIQEQVSWNFKDGECKGIGQLFADCTGTLNTQELMAIVNKFAARIGQFESGKPNRKVKVDLKAFLLFVLEASLQHDARHVFIDFVEDDLISVSLDAEEMSQRTLTKFQLGIVIARQLSKEIDSTFPSFGTWLHQAFGDQQKSIISNSSRRMKNFIELLTRIVPLETKAVFLRLHLSRPPVLFSNEKQTWNDYCHLVRTKLYDLNENACQKSVFDIDANSIDANDVPDITEVKEAAEKFRKLKKLPQSVLEASIFRRPYFLGRFLPTLVYWLKNGTENDSQQEDLQSLAVELCKKGNVPAQIVSDIKSAGLSLQS